MTKPTIGELMAATGISKTYASDILSGKQPPSRPLALYILRETGWRHDTLVGLTDAQIAVLSEIDRWTPPAAQDVAA